MQALQARYARWGPNKNTLFAREFIKIAAEGKVPVATLAETTMRRETDKLKMYALMRALQQQSKKKPVKKNKSLLA